MSKQTTSNSSTNTHSATAPPPLHTPTKLSLRIISWNCNRRKDPYIIQTLISSRTPDILHIQEPHSALSDPNTTQHKQLLQWLTSHKYSLIHFNTFTMTIISTATLDQHYTYPIITAPNQRASTAVFYLDSVHPLLITNVWAPHRSHPSYRTDTLQLKAFFQTLQADYPDAEHLIAGDINIDITNISASKYNILAFFTESMSLTSVIPEVHYQTNNSTQLDPTHYNNNDSTSHIDHILSSKSRCIQHCTYTKIDKDFITDHANSDHVPIIANFTYYITSTPQTDDAYSPLHHQYNRIAAIPIRILPLEDEEDRDPDFDPSWYQPDPIYIQTSKREPYTNIMRELHKASNDVDFAPLQTALTTATDILASHALTNPPEEIGLRLPPRTIPLQQAINTSFDLLTSMIDATITTAFNNIETSKTKKKLTHSDLQAKISQLYLENVKKLDALLAPYQGNPHKQRKKFNTTFNSFFAKHQDLDKLFTEQKERCETLIEDYTSTAADIEQYQADKKNQQQQTHSQNDSDSPPQQQPNKQHPNRRKSALSQDTRNKFSPGLQQGNHKPRRETLRTLKQAFKKTTAHLNSIHRQLQHIGLLLQKIAITKKAAARQKLIAQQLHPRYLQLRPRINSTLSVHNTTHINYNASFGPPKDLAKSLQQKEGQQIRANTHIPLSQGPHKPPKLIPAVGAQERLTATKETQQLQMAAPPGKALHFVDITEDDVGPSGIKLDLDRPFNRADLPTYHPHIHDLEDHIQQTIIDAHKEFPELLKKIKPDPHPPAAYKWPFNFTYNPQTKVTSFSGPLPDLELAAKPTPSKARMNHFTINVLARMPRCWLQHTTTLLQIILASRILPTKLKKCGRVLIDKPGTTDKRPISILHAFDSILDTTVGKTLSTTLERIDIFDDSILAYRKGRSSTDAVINHIITVQDILSQSPSAPDRKVLAQFDLDQEKFFDRLTTELQLLPFKFAGFPDKGYIEWLAESLTGTIVITVTPFGTVECFFLCGTRQGATTSTVNANMVGWLISIPWHTPHPKLKQITPGHTLRAINDQPLYDELSLTHDQQTYCDDASKYIVAPLSDLFLYLTHILKITSIMSIVTKLSINADKSSIRISGLDEHPIQQRPHLTVWHHSTKSVKRTKIRVLNMALQLDTYLYKMFGILLNRLGTPAKKHHTTLPQVRALTQSWKIGTISDRALVNHYPLYVTSICNFAVLAKGYNLFSCRKVDHDTITNLLRHHFHIHPSIDPIHQIILPTNMAGFHFTGFLTTTVLDAYCRELLVLSNNPFPDTITNVTARFTQAITNCYQSHTHTDDHLCPNALYQIALAGFYLRPTFMPLVNAMITHIASNATNHEPFGTPPQTTTPPPNPLDGMLKITNTNFATHSRYYQDCIRVLYSKITRSPYQTSLLPQQHQLLFEVQHYPTSYQTPLQGAPDYNIHLALQPALQQIHTTHQQLLTFYSPQALLSTDENPIPPITSYLHDSPLPLNTLLAHHYQWDTNDDRTHDANAIFRQATETIRTPPPTDELSIPRTPHIQHMQYAMRTATTKYKSPIILSGDSSATSKSPIITSVTFLLAIDFTHTPEPRWNEDIPIPLHYRAHILPPTVGTMPTNNNMGEIHAATIALNTAPYDHPIIIILDSHTTLHLIYTFFFPTGSSNRDHIRTTYPTNNTYYVSELHEALDKHWRHSIPLPRLAGRHPHLAPAIANFQFISTMLQETYGPNTHIDMRPPSSNTSRRTPKWSKFTKTLQYDNLLFVHVESHQLTKAGEPKSKRMRDGSLKPITVTPNRLFALLNSYADNICSRITQDSSNFSHQPPNIPQPPITRLQNVIYHNGSIVTQPIKDYINTQLYHHAVSRLQLHPNSWFLDIVPNLHDPTQSIANDHIRRELITSRALSHYRLLLTNEAYAKQWTKPQPPQVNTTECPLCKRPNLHVADHLHHHYTCTHPTIVTTRQTSLQLIRDAATHLQSLLHTTRDLLRPKIPHADSQNIIKLLLSALTQTHTDQTYTLQDTQEMHQTGCLPTRLQPPQPIATLHRTIDSIYTTPPVPTQSQSYTYLNTIPITGLFPHQAHTLLDTYTTNLITLIHHHYPRNTHTTNEIETINSIVNPFFQLETEAKTLKDAFHRAWTQLFTTIHKHPVTMQTTITKILLDTRDTIPLPPPNTPNPRTNNKSKRQKTSPPDEQDSNQPPEPCPCQAIRCKIRCEKGLPPKDTPPLTCKDCKTYDAALTAATACTNILTNDPTQLVQSLLNMLPFFHQLDPTDTTTDNMTQTLTTYTTSTTDLSAALYTTLPPSITENINTDINLLPYQAEDDIQLPLNHITETTLHFLATTLLLQLHPQTPPEFPTQTAPHIAQTLNTALTICRCHPYRPPDQSNPTINPQDIKRELCTACHLLIQKAPISPPLSLQTTPHCITCAKEYDNYIYTDKPCQTCMIAALLHQNRPQRWYFQYTQDLPNTIPSLFTQMTTTQYNRT